MISLHQVTKTYETPAGKFAALKAIDLNIEAGQFVGIGQNRPQKGGRRGRYQVSELVELTVDEPMAMAA